MEMGELVSKFHVYQLASLVYGSPLPGLMRRLVPAKCHRLLPNANMKVPFKGIIKACGPWCMGRVRHVEEEMFKGENASRMPQTGTRFMMKVHFNAV